MRLAELGIAKPPAVQKAGGCVFFGIVKDPTDSWPRGGWLALMHFKASLRSACLPSGSVWVKFNRGRFSGLVEVMGDVAEDPNDPKPPPQHLSRVSLREWSKRRNGNQ
jgi:hypothetical protein